MYYVEPPVIEDSELRYAFHVYLRVLSLFTDLIADTAMARQGFPRTGISACFGGPLFSIL